MRKRVVLTGIEFYPPYRTGSKEYDAVDRIAPDSVKRNCSHSLDAKEDSLRVMAEMPNGSSKSHGGECKSEAAIRCGMYGLALDEWQPQSFREAESAVRRWAADSAEER